MSPGDLEGLFGLPSFTRIEEPARYWRYSYRGCALDLFLYGDNKSGDFEVGYFQIRETMHQASWSEGARQCRRLETLIGRESEGPSTL